MAFEIREVITLFTVRIALLMLAYVGVSFFGGCHEDKTEKPLDAITSATPGVSQIVLDSSHEGWADPACKSCHDTLHTSGYSSSDCSSCHGVNGSPSRPADHQDGSCGECHDDQHTGLDIESPQGCRACHRYAVTDGCSHTEDYDVVVIGAGGGGLAAASVLARNGVAVLLLEQHHKVGGCMVNFDRGDYRFEASLHAFDGWGMSYLNALQITDQLEPVSGDVMYRLIFPDLIFDVPADKDDYRAALKAQFPAEADSIDSLLEGMSVVNIAQYEGMSVLDAVLSHGVQDEKLIAVFTALTGFLAALPEVLPAEKFVGMWDSYHTLGYHYFVGGSQAIADALASSIVDHGGAIKLHTRASKIAVQGNQVVRVETTDGGCYNTSHVISNASAMATFLELVGAEHLPLALVEEVQGRAPATSYIAMVYLGVDRDYTNLFPGNTHEIFVNNSYDTSAEYTNNVMCLPEEVSFVIGNYSVLDPTAAPAGKNAIVITADFLSYECNNEWNWGVSYDSYKEYKAALAETLVQRAEEYLPELSQHIEVLELASPHTIERYTLNPRGSWAGWEFQLDQQHQYTETQETPIDGLFLAGAWVGGAGQSVALGSGITAASLVMDAMGQ